MTHWTDDWRDMRRAMRRYMRPMANGGTLMADYLEAIAAAGSVMQAWVADPHVSGWKIDRMMTGLMRRLRDLLDYMEPWHPVQP